MTQTFKTLPDAIALAEFAHRNQLDKAGLPYVEHPKRVLSKVQAMGGLPFVQIAAVLHDVTEDTAFDSGMLIDLGFSEAAIRLVDMLDRGFSEKLFELTTGQTVSDREAANRYYYAQIKADPNARMIKLADIEDNLSPWRLSYLEPATQDRLKAKYAKALAALDA
jgi:(p)ppGpp synthase/HD superfamily hydrolase